MEAVPEEGAAGAVEDLPTPCVEVCLGYASHAVNVKRTFLLDKRAARRDGGHILKNERSFFLDFVPSQEARRVPRRKP
ncbi:hypothetical protein GCM10009801_15170 [Streptomyces albiaxialis]|uniref:Uncharacterized protein n=1 Tax=Streptomyces albiaxialis TaxID=329523 RepID=A0ABP5HAY2_9ACTN